LLIFAGLKPCPTSIHVLPLVLKKAKYHERRKHYGNTHPLGNIFNKGQGKGEEGEKVNFDGLL
jgi:hypothetical protein